MTDTLEESVYLRLIRTSNETMDRLTVEFIGEKIRQSKPGTGMAYIIGTTMSSEEFADLCLSNGWLVDEYRDTLTSNSSVGLECWAIHAKHNKI